MAQSCAGSKSLLNHPRLFKGALCFGYSITIGVMWFINYTYENRYIIGRYLLGTGHSSQKNFS